MMIQHVIRILVMSVERVQKNILILSLSITKVSACDIKFIRNPSRNKTVGGFRDPFPIFSSFGKQISGTREVMSHRKQGREHCRTSRGRFVSMRGIYLIAFSIGISELLASASAIHTWRAGVLRERSENAILVPRLRDILPIPGQPRRENRSPRTSRSPRP